MFGLCRDQVAVQGQQLEPGGVDVEIKGREMPRPACLAVALWNGSDPYFGLLREFCDW